MNDCEENTQRNDSEAEAARSFVSSVILLAYQKAKTESWFDSTAQASSQGANFGS